MKYLIWNVWGLQKETCCCSHTAALYRVHVHVHPTCVQALQTEQINTYSCRYSHEMSSLAGLPVCSALLVLCANKSQDFGARLQAQLFKPLRKGKAFITMWKWVGFLYIETLSPHFKMELIGLAAQWRAVVVAVPAAGPALIVIHNHSSWHSDAKCKYC